MSLAPGDRVGVYDIIAPLGVGGMGEVYKATDTRLRRSVALKLLPAAYASDSDRVRRFEQEARAAAALNHPNILAIYDVGSDGQGTYLVSELLEGQPSETFSAVGRFRCARLWSMRCRSRTDLPRRTRKASFIGT
jgi:eukaryotic-like serine/threonine-protein kinase